MTELGARLAPLGVADPLAARALALDLEQRYFVWDGFVAGKRRVDLHPLVLSEAAHEEAVRVARGALEVVTRAAERAAVDPDERARYRLHADVEHLAAASRAARDDARLSRVDLLLRADGRFVACEVNADCPGGHNEALALPRLARAAGFSRGSNPTRVVERLVDRLVALSGGAGSPRGAIGLVFATAYAEDLQVCALVERLVAERGGRALRVPSTAPKADGDGVAFRGERLSVLYRFYPIEQMAGQRNVAALASAVERGALATVSSFASAYAQSKLAMARAFELEPGAAREVFPETVAFAPDDRGLLVRARRDWVVKRDLSRVGDDVLVGELFTDDAFGAALGAIADDVRDGGVWIAQRFVEPAAIATPWGPRALTLGAYFLDGAFEGYYARLSETSLCTHDALAVPVFVDAAAEEGRAA